jgi:hypothetical protein
MRGLLRLLFVSLFVVVLVAVHTPGAAAAADPSPVLIDRAMADGTLDFETGHLYLAYSLFAPEKLPAAYQSDTPFHGAVWLLKLRRAVERMPIGVERAEIEALIGVGPADVGTSVCELSPLPNTNVLETEHFHIEYNAAEVNLGPDGLTIDDYARSLEGSWAAEVDAFAWAAPPSNPANPAPAGKYLVKVQNLSPVLYGYVSNFGTGAGFVGDNPNTSWDDQDAYASCMGLNSDYAFFPGTPARALDATTAHEFNHSIQFGYGALHGDNAPDSVFVEGGATWMEDEVYDYANDNYNYLWPRFNNDMGEYEDSPYPYWITFRGLTERYGSSVAGGGEDVMQAFWELTSRNEASNLDAIDLALRTHGTTLPNAYHAYAVAVKFNRRCGGGYVYPYCFEEGPEYVNGDGVQSGNGETRAHGTIAQVGGSFAGSIPDNYALNWVVLPRQSKSYRVTFTNGSAGGSFRVSLACDTGTRLTVMALKGLAGPGGKIQGTASKSSSCQQLVAVITNLAETAANPDTSEQRGYTLSTS